MVRDVQLRLLFIPLLGLLIPAVSGIITYEKYSAAQLIISNCYFILTSFIIWGGCNWIHMRIRPLFRKTQNPFFKIVAISIVSALYGAASGGAMTMIWFRISKDNFTWEEFVSLFKELEFIESYFFLLQVRHENKLLFELDAKEPETRKIMMPPCALQTVVENAIKHNEFSVENPLMIRLTLNGEYLKIINNKRPKPYLVNSTSIGLRNLSSRYKLVCNKNIVIENEESHFLVKLPLITNL